MEVKEHTRDLGTWGFLRPGWWVLHIISIIIVAYLGYWLLSR